MTAAEARRALDRLPLLAGVPEAARDRLATAARPVRHAAGAPIFRRGEAGADGMLLVLDGLVRLHLSGPDGREMSLGLVGPGEPVGEIALIDGGPRSADATALTPVSGLMIRHADAAAVIAEDVAAANALLRTLAARLRRTTEQAEGLGLKALPARLAGVLLRIAAADPSGLVRLPQGQIAALAAASRPKVNAVLAEFRDGGLVEPVRAGLRLVDRPALRALAEGLPSASRSGGQNR
jgi:CRP-like cAMP-binding protein